MTLPFEDRSWSTASLLISDRFLRQQLCKYVGDRFSATDLAQSMCEMGNLHFFESESQRCSTRGTEVLCLFCACSGQTRRCCSSWAMGTFSSGIGTRETRRNWLPVDRSGYS